MREMKQVTITILLVITLILFSGCTGQDETAVPEQVQQTTTHGSTPSRTLIQTSVPHSATTVQVEQTNPPIRLFNGEYHWVEYRINNTVTMPPNPRSSSFSTVKLERSILSFNGSPAIRYKTTWVSDYAEMFDNKVTKVKDGLVFNDESYYDPATWHLLSETTTKTVKGTTPEQVNTSDYYSKHMKEDRPGGWIGITPFEEMDIPLVDLGTDPVGVPLGDFKETQKISGKFKDGTPVSIWIVKSIPVPIKIEYPNKYMDGEDPVQMFELKGWG
jgi:hypothetical protein